jgi:Cft2 family RNA processing exonuclease
VLISNVHSLLALPFLTEHCPGFKAKIYATEPTKYLGR